MNPASRNNRHACLKRARARLGYDGKEQCSIDQRHPPSCGGPPGFSTSGSKMTIMPLCLGWSSITYMFKES